MVGAVYAAGAKFRLRLEPLVTGLIETERAALG
jgi:hypothetical protein